MTPNVAKRAAMEHLQKSLHLRLHFFRFCTFCRRGPSKITTPPFALFLFLYFLVSHAPWGSPREGAALGLPGGVRVPAAPRCRARSGLPSPRSGPLRAPCCLRNWSSRAALQICKVWPRGADPVDRVPNLQLYKTLGAMLRAVAPRATGELA
jgi:hypothetical protein